jgi:hypothetical protein
MAFVKLVDAPPRVLNREQALSLWEVLKGRQEPLNKAQAIFASKVDRLYIPYEYAPEDYKEMYPEPIETEERELSWYQK